MCGNRRKEKKTGEYVKKVILSGGYQMDPIIKAKLMPPRLNRYLIDRPRLVRPTGRSGQILPRRISAGIQLNWVTIPMMELKSNLIADRASVDGTLSSVPTQFTTFGA
jgi:hypothetical protein